MAEAAYAAAGDFDSGAVGARCNRLRLMADHPDRQAAVQREYESLVKNFSSAPEVAITGAMLALADGKPDVAQKRLAAGRPALADDAPSLAANRATAHVLVAAAAGDWPKVAEHAEQLPADATLARSAAAAAAWNRGDDAKALELASANTEVALVLAVQRGEVGAAARAGPAAIGAGARAWRGWALARTGDVAGGQREVGQALKDSPQDPAVVEAAAAVALLAGEHAWARDTLAGLLAREPSAGWSAWFNLGVAQLRSGDLAAARTAFGRAAAACPGCKAAAKNRDALAGLLGAAP